MLLVSLECYHLPRRSHVLPSREGCVLNVKWEGKQQQARRPPPFPSRRSWVLLMVLLTLATLLAAWSDVRHWLLCSLCFWVDRVSKYLRALYILSWANMVYIYVVCWWADDLYSFICKKNVFIWAGVQRRNWMGALLTVSMDFSPTCWQKFVRFSQINSKSHHGGHRLKFARWWTWGGGGQRYPDM